MESIDKLREYARVSWGPWEESREHVNEMLDAIEAEIAERYMELPLDADGVPIRVGDMLELGMTNGKVMALMYRPSHSEDSMPWELQCSSNGEWYNTKFARHYEPRTLENVLEVFIADYDRWDNCSSGQGRMDERKELFAKYAAEIRELMEVES